jgi:carbonic anhydrase
MRLFESILDANHRAVAGDASAGLHPADYADSLPVVALTCIDPRLNAYFPNALALPAEQFIWLRNAGNIITSPLSSTMRSLALACAVKGGREIAVIGHSDCQICKTTVMALLDKLKALGVDRSRLPENLNEFFGMFGSERQNVIKACDFIRNSSLIGPNIPVHGLLLDLDTGKLESVVNGYDALNARSAAGVPGHAPQAIPGGPMNSWGTSLGTFKDFAIGELKFPEAKIGEMATHIEQAVAREADTLQAKIGAKIGSMAGTAEQIGGQVAEYAQQHWPQPPPLRTKPSVLAPKKTSPPPLRPRPDLRRG